MSIYRRGGLQQCSGGPYPLCGVASGWFPTKGLAVTIHVQIAAVDHHGEGDQNRPGELEGLLLRILAAPDAPLLANRTCGYYIGYNLLDFG